MKKLPNKTDMDFILCDDVRPELGDKVTILGLYGGRDVKFADLNQPLAMASLTFVFIWRSGEGDFDTHFSITGPSNTQLIPKTKLSDVKKSPGIAATAVIQFKPFLFQLPGKHVARVTLDSQAYDVEFEVH